MNINEEQNRAKLIKLRKRHLIAKQQFYKTFGIQYRLHLHFYLLWKEGIACTLSTWRSWINVRDASIFVFHAIEHEISLSNNATLIQSELIRMFFITYDKREHCFYSLRAKTIKSRGRRIKSSLDYPDSLGPHAIVRIFKGPDNRKYEY